MVADTLPTQLIRTNRFTAGAPHALHLPSLAPASPFPLDRTFYLRDGHLWRGERLLAEGPVAEYGVGGELVVFVRDGQLWGPTGVLTDFPVTDPRPDPTGRRIAYLRDGNLEVLEISGETTGFGPAATPHTAAGRSFWWSPDGSRLLVSRPFASTPSQPPETTPSQPPETMLSQPPESTLSQPPERTNVLSTGAGSTTASRPGEPAPPAHEAIPLPGDPAPPAHEAIPLPGEPLPRFGLEITGGGPVFDDFDYLIDGGWDGHGPWAVVQSRDQRTVRFLSLEPFAEIATLRDDRWVHIVPGLPRRTASGAVVAHEDRDGTRFLTVNGGAVTPPGRQLREVLSVTGENVLFTASDDPLTTEHWLYDGDLRRVHVPVPASHAERPVLDLNRTTLILGPRRLRAHLYRPHGHDGGRLPVLLDPYGGPARQRVTDVPDHRAYLSQWFAELGFAVLVIDGSGTPGRGPDWEKETYGDPFGPVLDDQIAGLRAAARLHPWLDPERVGIRGWSFSGTVAIKAVIERPDVFHVAVAGAGVTDQRRYDAYLRERHLGPPRDHPERYDRLSLLEAAPRLTRPLLLMHGTADRNVDPSHTLRMSQALTAAGRPHELMLLPGVGHVAVGAPGTEALLDRQARFLSRHLGG
jgi:dipeptidyl-peptidase-4